MRLHLLSNAGALLTTVVLLLAADANAPAVDNWTRDVTGGRTMSAYYGSRFVILLISCLDNHILANCGFRDFDHQASVLLHGSFDSDGNFWPRVLYEVSIGKNKWRSVFETPGSTNSVGIKIDSTNPATLLKVNMDPFRPVIGRYRWGRIVLENSDAAIFSLDDLLPTGDDPRSADFKTDVRDDEPSRLGSSFSLISVTAFSGRLTGEFKSNCRGKNCTAKLAGLTDSNGDFSPFVKLQIGNADLNWKTLQESERGRTTNALEISLQNPEQTVFVELSAYKSLIGKIKYGKVVFSNEDFSVFRLDTLMPSFTKPPSIPDRN